MDKELVINVSRGETRTALLENGQLAEIHIERAKKSGGVGTIYKGRVKKVLPGMQSAFVDIGLVKDAFLYISDVDERLKNFDFFDEEYLKKPPVGNGRRKRRGSDSRKIAEILSVGQEILVQIVREPLGTKGARITTHLSIAGRYLVLMPTVVHVGVSRKIKSYSERKRLKTLMGDIKMEGLGAIVRTAAEGKEVKDLKKDFKALQKRWKLLKKLADKELPPAIVYEDENMTVRLIRDVLDDRFKGVHIDNAKEFKQLKAFLSDYSPGHKKNLQLYKDKTPIFDHYDIEEKLQRLFRNKIWLKSGGHLIINQTEAFVAIDVNTGKFVGAKNLEDTILRLNLEAIREIVHQIRLRDLGGIIVIDFIDMEIRANRKKVVNAFFREMKKDRALYKILPINEFGLLHLTRKRVKSSFAKMMSRHCPHCDGMGYIKSSQTICFEVVREILKMVPHLSSKKILVRAHPEIIELFKTEEYELIRDIEKTTKKKYILKEDRGLHHENFDIMSA